MTDIVTDKYKVADIELADYGAKEVSIAEGEMVALMALRKKYKKEQPLKGARILGSIHMTIQTAVLVDTLTALGAEVSWTSCNIFSTQDHAAAYLAKKGVPVFAWKGQTPEEGEECLRKQVKALPEPNVILDDGGDLTNIVHSEFSDLLKNIVGISEETTTGVHNLEKMMKRGELTIPAINVNDSITKSKNDNKIGCRHSLNDAIKRGTDKLMSGRKAMVVGYGDVGKGSSQSLRQEGMIVHVTEIDPICAMQAQHDGYEVVSPYIDGDFEKGVNKDLMAGYDIIVTTTGNVEVCDYTMMTSLKDGCIVCNIGHFDTEIDTARLREECRWEEIKPQVHRLSWDNGNYIILLSEGRLVNLGNATGHPSAVMDGSFANQVLAQIYLYNPSVLGLEKPEGVWIEVLPKRLDEEVARYMVEGNGGTLTRLRPHQAEYLELDPDGPYKPKSYHY